jgi:hypothetical protein
MKTLWLLLLMVVPLQLVHAQEVKHAPTAEQCRADQKLWRSKLDQAPIPSGVKDVSFMELVNWYTEMKDCISVDPDHRTDYLVTLTSIDSTQMTRIVNFLDRHHLTWNQFLAEDAQGKR